jgi:hypothetical protein
MIRLTPQVPMKSRSKFSAASATRLIAFSPPTVTGGAMPSRKFD